MTPTQQLKKRPVVSRCMPRVYDEGRICLGIGHLAINERPDKAAEEEKIGC
jgi:hypothetical protein